MARYTELNLVILDRRDSTEALTIPTIILEGLESEVSNSRLRIAEIKSTSGVLRGALLQDSTLSMSTIFLPKPDTLPPDTTAPWKITIDNIALEDYTVHLEDRTTNPLAQFEFIPVNLTMANFVSGVPDQAAQLDVSMRIKEGGELKAQGTYITEPPETSLKVQVDNLPLVTFQPYISGFGKIELKSGALSLTGNYHDQLQGGQTFVDFKGKVQVERLRAVDLILNEDFLRWDRLNINGIEYQQNPPSVVINEVIARRSYLRMIIAQDFTTNIQHILGIVPDSLDATDSAQTDGKSPSTDTGEVMPMRIDLVEIIDSEMNCSDFSLTPNFNVGILELDGAITGLSSEQLDSAKVELDGKVDKYAPVTINGLINPLTEDAFTDINMNFQSIELTTFTPYSGKFLGYKIDKGKLHLDLHYVLSGNLLNSENILCLNNWAWENLLKARTQPACP